MTAQPDPTTTHEEKPMNETSRRCRMSAETTPLEAARVAPTPAFLPGTRAPITPRERAADAVWRHEGYDGASLVTARDADGIALAALTAALDVEEMARALHALHAARPTTCSTCTFRAAAVVDHLLGGAA